MKCQQMLRLDYIRGSNGTRHGVRWDDAFENENEKNPRQVLMIL
jgi:hypothetical protein